MITTACELAAVAYALIGNDVSLTPKEAKLIPKKRAPAKLVEETRAEIIKGNDPLGEAFCVIRSPLARRKQGATYTPAMVVQAMIGWAKAEGRNPVRVVDAGAGSGRFTVAAAKAFPKAKLIAVELDPLATLMLRANAAVCGFAGRLDVQLADYRNIGLPHVKGATLFIGNPPYVRHHDIQLRWKKWLAETAAALGFKASGLAGLHIHFFLKTRTLAKEGDFGTFITASEWMDVNYGSLLRAMLADGLGGSAVHVIDPKAQLFADAMSTGSITCFRVGQRPEQLIMRSVENLEDLSTLSTGRAVEWSDLQASKKWTILIRESRKPNTDEIELGEFFRVHRGQVSGNNAVWIENPAALELPARFLIPTITRARDILDAGDELLDAKRLKRVIDLPVDLSELTKSEKKIVDRFLAWARRQGGNKGWIATHRQAWWSVGLRAPAPIVCTYMARRVPAFVRNRAEARHLNIAHGLYPREPMTDAALDAVIHHLRATINVSSGRTYAGGLVKFEPGEVARLHIPSPALFAASRSA